MLIVRARAFALRRQLHTTKASVAVAVLKEMAQAGSGSASATSMLPQDQADAAATLKQGGHHGVRRHQFEGVVWHD